MRKIVMLVLAVLLLVPPAAMGQKQNRAPNKPDKYAVFKTRTEYGESLFKKVPLLNKISFLNKPLCKSTVSDSYVWSDWKVGAVVVSPDGRYLLTGTRLGELDLWDLESPEKSRPHFASFGPLQSRSPYIPSELSWLAWTGDGSQIAVTYCEKLFLLDANSAEILHTIALPQEAVNWGNALFGNMPFALSACGGFFAYEGYEDDISCIKVINTETDEVVFKRNLPVVTWHNSFAHHNDDLYPDPDKGQDILTPPCFSPDGRFLFIALRYHGMEIWDAKTGETVAALNVENRIDPNEKWRTERAAFSPDGQYLVTAGIVHDKELSYLEQLPIGKVFLWDTQTFQPLQEWNFEADEFGVGVVSVAFSPDGKQVLVGYITRRDLAENEILLALNVAQFDANSGQLLKSREITQCGALPLIPEFRVLCNSQAYTIHHLPESITFDVEMSFREKIQSFFDIRRLLPFP